MSQTVKMLQVKKSMISTLLPKANNIAFLTAEQTERQYVFVFSLVVCPSKNIGSVRIDRQCRNNHLINSCLAFFHQLKFKLIFISSLPGRYHNSKKRMILGIIQRQNTILFGKIECIQVKYVRWIPQAISIFCDLG